MSALPVPLFPASPRRLAALVTGYVFLVLMAFLFLRVPFWCDLCFLLAGMLCHHVAYGNFASAKFSARQGLLFIAGGTALLLILHSTGYRRLAEASAWMPRQPILLYFVLAGGVLEFLRFRAGRRLTRRSGQRGR